MLTIPQMHPIFSVGMFAHLTNCFFFTLGLVMRQSNESEICSSSIQIHKLAPDDQYAIKCLKRVLSCEDMDGNFKYWVSFTRHATLSSSFLAFFVTIYLQFFLYSSSFDSSCSRLAASSWESHYYYILIDTPGLTTPHFVKCSAVAWADIVVIVVVVLIIVVWLSVPCQVCETTIILLLISNSNHRKCFYASSVAIYSCFDEDGKHILLCFDESPSLCARYVR